MSIRTRDENRAYYPSGWLEELGGESYRFRRGVARSLLGLVEVYEQVERNGEQYIMLEAIVDGRARYRTEWRTKRDHIRSERGLLIHARKWLAEVIAEDA